MSDSPDVLESIEVLLSAIKSFCGIGLEVANWHDNDDMEPLDNLIQENMDADWDEMEAALSLAIVNKAKAERLALVVATLDKFIEEARPMAESNKDGKTEYVVSCENLVFRLGEILKLAKGETP